MKTALICVLIAGLMPYLWTTVAKIAGPRYDNRNVRDWQSKLTGLAQRAHAAHLNSFEAFPFFAAAVLAAASGAQGYDARPVLSNQARRRRTVRRFALGSAVSTSTEVSRAPPGGRRSRLCSGSLSQT